MQDRYAGDIGDYVKIALLRFLIQEDVRRRLGVAWCRTPNEKGNEAGRYTEYLDRRPHWREKFCKDTFDKLEPIGKAARESRSVKRLEETGLLDGTRFHSEYVRARDRALWFKQVTAALKPCDLVFVDPDNGIQSEDSTDRRISNKSISLVELAALAKERPLVAYHHQTRKAGGHLKEIDDLHARLRKRGLNPLGSLRARPWSARLFIFLNFETQHEDVASQFAGRWENEVHWYPARDRAANGTLPKPPKRC
jgi:hypothetical protein